MNPESNGAPKSNGRSIEVTKTETLCSQAQSGWSSLTAGLEELLVILFQT